MAHRSLSNLLLLLLLLFAAVVSAQNVVLTGAIAGRVTDLMGAVVPDAHVVLRNLDTGLEQTRSASGAGLYDFAALMPGTYSLTISVAGFRETSMLVRVLVGGTTRQDVRLRVGTQPETVQVRTPQLRPAESSQSTTLDRSVIAELPLNGRRYTDFMTLSPNTSYDGDTGLVSVGGQQGGEDSGYANGNGSTAFTVDGSNATNNYFSDIMGRYRIPYLYGEEAIQEFQVSVSPYSAVYGGGAGFVNAVTRSGSNVFHGSAFYYNRNSATGANDALDKAAGNPRPQDALQQFGAGLGGPIRRNCLWFFLDYEQQLRNDPIPVINSALTTNAGNPGSFLEANFALPGNTTLPAPNGPLPIPGTDTAPDPSNPVYLQQVANAINALNENLGTGPRKRNDIVATPRIDWQAGAGDGVFMSLNLNRFNSPGGVITDPTVGNYGLQSLANAYVRTEEATAGWTHAFSPRVLNEFHAGTSQDNEIATPTGLAPNTPTIVLDSPAAFILGNNAFSIGRVFERQYSLADRIDLAMGRTTLQLGFDWNRSWDADTNDGGADPNEAVDFGSPLGLYEFPNLEAFALGEYINFSQVSGEPRFRFGLPYYGFYVQDTFRALPQLTIEAGLREDFQVYPQPMENPAFPLTGQYRNQSLRLAPRLGFAWQPMAKTVVRGGFGDFYTNMNGLNYRNAVISNGLASQESSVSASYTSGAPNQQTPVFPQILPGNSPLFAASPDISLISPQFRVPYILEASLQIEREIAPNTTLAVGTMWNHGVHILSGSAYDLNLMPLAGTTTYIVCPASAQAAPCSGPSISLPNMDSGLLTEGYINSNLGQINELVSTAQNYYNSLFVQVERRMAENLSLEASWTYARSMMGNGMDFNNQFNLGNTYAPSLLDQRHRLTLAAVYRPHGEQLVHARAARSALSGWTLSTVMEFSSGRPYAGLLSPACTSSTLSFSNCNGADDNLNDTAFNEDTANTAGGINGAGPTPGIGLNSFYGPWLERVDAGLSRWFAVKEHLGLELQAQAFNLFNHANYYVQNGDGINQLQYNPIGSNCGDGMTLNQTCYLVPNSGPGNFGTYQEISPNGLPRVLQFSGRLTF
jgi:Carboxypeptidase regulatory-like domain